MDKRTILAFVLMFIVLFGFQFWQLKTAPKRPPAPPRPDSRATDTPPTDDASHPAEPPTSTAVQVPASPVPGVQARSEETTLENDLFIARFSTDGAKLVSYTLKKYFAEDKKTPLDLLMSSTSPSPALLLDVQGLRTMEQTWALEERPGARVFRLALDHGFVVEKEVAFGPDAYSLDVTIRYVNPPESTPLAYTLYGPTGMRPEDESHTPPRPDRVAVGSIFAVAGLVKGAEAELKAEPADKVPPPESGKTLEYAGNTTFGGAASKYFAVVLAPSENVPSPTLLLQQAKIEIADHPPFPNIRAGYSVGKLRLPPPSQHFLLFAGPKIDEILGKYSKYKLERLLDFTSLVPGSEALSTIFLAILRRLERVALSYGVAIILLTVLVRIALHPLSRASMRNMYKMQKLAPKVREIQERYKGKKSKEAAQKMNLEVMELYRSHGTSPILGCLPTLFQLPVFIGLYNSLAYSIELRQTEFLYIRDLSRPDRLFSFGVNIPFFGGYFNLLPVLMVITMVVQQRMQPTPPDSQQQQQAKMMQYMMVLFGVLFYHVPSGLVLYFLTSSLLGMAEQKWVKRRLLLEEQRAATGAS